MVDYPDAPAAPNYVIYERSFAQMKINMMHERDQALTASSSSAAHGTSKKKEVSQEDKKA